MIESYDKDAVIHCAAWTVVDMAEDDDKVAKVRAINAGGTQNIADVCKKLDCKMTYGFMVYKIISKKEKKFELYGIVAMPIRV